MDHDHANSHRGCCAIHIGLDALQCLPVVPWHPLPRTVLQFIRVSLQLAEVVKGIDRGQFCGVDEGHVEIAYPGTVLGLVEQCVLAVQDRFLQPSFA